MRTALGEEGYQAAWEAGRALPLEAAVAEALTLAEKIVTMADTPPLLTGQLAPP